MALENSYNKIWELWLKLLFLSHYQGSAVRGFLVNQLIEVENVKEGTFVARKHTFDHLKGIGGLDL